MSSLITYACAYAVIFGAGSWYLLKMIRRGPHPDETPPEHGGGQTAARPWRLATTNGTTPRHRRRVVRDDARTRAAGCLARPERLRCAVVCAAPRIRSRAG